MVRAGDAHGVDHGLPLVLCENQRDMLVAAFAPKPQCRSVTPADADVAAFDRHIGVELEPAVNADGDGRNAPILAVGSSRDADDLEVCVIESTSRTFEEPGYVELRAVV
jgi:hypothetical protein